MTRGHEAVRTATVSANVTGCPFRMTGVGATPQFRCLLGLAEVGWAAGALSRHALEARLLSCLAYAARPRT